MNTEQNMKQAIEQRLRSDDWCCRISQNVAARFQRGQARRRRIMALVSAAFLSGAALIGYQESDTIYTMINGDIEGERAVELLYSDPLISSLDIFTPTD